MPAASTASWRFTDALLNGQTGLGWPTIQPPALDTYLPRSPRFPTARHAHPHKHPPPPPPLPHCAGVDPKSIVCEFFRHNQCTKGNKCKFSHDLSVERKGPKISLYADQRDLGKDGEDKEVRQGVLCGQAQRESPGGRRALTCVPVCMLDDTRGEDVCVCSPSSGTMWASFLAANTHANTHVHTQGMEDWDQATLEAAVKQKHANENKPTDIICKFFLEAVEKKLYGWWVRRAWVGGCL